MTLPPFVEPAGHGIHTIDTGYHRPRFDAAYLIVDHGRAAFVDTGTNHGVPRLMAALDALGLKPDAVDWVIPTHVHLDHAGGCGLLMQQLPNAQLLVHPRGARHMIDPTALYEGELAVYGADEMERSYGRLVGVPAERVVSSADGQRIGLGGRSLEIIDSPGHARHHHAIWDGVSRAWFTGDTFGLSYPEFVNADGPWMLPTSTPVQFEPDAQIASIGRMLQRDPQRMFVTHYGPVDDVLRQARALVRQIEASVAIGLAVDGGPGRHEALKAALARHYLDSLHAHGTTRPDTEVLAILAMDIELNAQGLGVWLDKRSKPAPS
jgi:glyoxylase-like metal-dependent hydrolase (beta-lactamase superfamily II)